MEEIRYDTLYDRPPIQPDAETFYSAELIDLVGECLSPYPDCRTEVAELWAKIQTAVYAKPTDAPNGVPWKFRKMTEQDVLHYKPDNYALFAR